MPHIDNHNVAHQSARCFPAIGGGWAVKMKMEREDRDFLFGGYSDRQTAERIVEIANALDRDAVSTVTAIEGRAQQPKEVEHAAKVA